MRKLIANQDFSVGSVSYKKGDVVNDFHGLSRADQWKYRACVEVEKMKSPRQHIEDCKVEAVAVICDTDEKVPNEVKE